VDYPSQGHLVLQPLLLLQAPTAATYRCWLSGTSGQDPLTAVATNYAGSATTWLQVSATNDAGASWWQNLPCDAHGDTSPSATNGYSSCLYLGGASGQQQLYVFDNDGSPPKVWDATSDAAGNLPAFVDASDSLMLTTCYYGTDSCTGANSEGWWTHIWDDPGGTAVDSHLELIQLNPNGSVCNSTQSPEERSWVGNLPHHYMIYHSLSTVPVYSCGGSRRFKLRISVKYVSGNPVKVDGSLWTHAYAFNSFYGTAPAVPYLIGLTEGAAANYLTTTGYAVPAVSTTLNSALAATVISQYPSAGIIELPGSTVNLTVSTGGVVVPNLLGDPQSSATAAIKALGLIPTVGSQKECINPGEVLTQSPPSGTLVQTGSTVYITVDSGTLKTCIIK
jgi:hypothetical protein